MLRVTRLSDPTGRYYLPDLEAGRWVGAGSAGLTLVGAPERGSWRAVLDGRDPGSGAPLRARSARVTGYDLTFAAPKSVSVLFGLAGPEVAAGLLEAQREASASALAYVASHAAAARRTEKEARRHEPVRGLVAAAFDHTVSRALDPHLHTHVVVANLAQGRDGRWGAFDGRGLFAHARAAGALYDAHLRRLVHERLGLEWAPRPNGAYELGAVDPVLVGGFSARSAEIQAHLADRASILGTSRPSGAARRVAWAATRDPKAPDAPTAGALRARWARRAADLGVAPALAHALDVASGPTPDRDRARPAPPRLDEHRLGAGLWETAPAGAARRDVVAAWAGAVREGVAAHEVDACVDALGPWGEGVGVSEGRLPLRALLVRQHHLRALGPRPATPDALALWRSAAEELDRHRARWQLDGAREPLGVAGDPQELARMGAAQLAAHLSAARSVSDARRRLGDDPRTRRTEPPGLERAPQLGR